MTGGTKRIAGTVLVLVVLVAILVIHYKTAAKDGEPCQRARDCRRMWGTVCVIRDTGNYCSKACDAPTDCWDGWTCTNALANKRRSTRERQVCVRE